MFGAVFGVPARRHKIIQMIRYASWGKLRVHTIDSRCHTSIHRCCWVRTGPSKFQNLVNALISAVGSLRNSTCAKTLSHRNALRRSNCTGKCPLACSNICQIFVKKYFHMLEKSTFFCFDGAKMSLF